MALDFVVVHGANLSCSIGSVPSTLTITDAARKSKLESKAVGIVSDSGLPNIGTFGTCPNLGPGPCAPVVPGNWTPGCLKNKLGNTAVIKKSDTLVCTVGGTISITNAQQTKGKGE